MEEESVILYCPKCGIEMGCSEKSCNGCGYVCVAADKYAPHTHNPEHMMFYPDCPACQQERLSESLP